MDSLLHHQVIAEPLIIWATTSIKLRALLLYSVCGDAYGIRTHETAAVKGQCVKPIFTNAPNLLYSAVESNHHSSVTEFAVNYEIIVKP